MNELVSVIIPVYNASKYLKRCIESVLNQTYKNIELIAINDGSVDNSLTILECFAKNDSRMIVISKENEGVSKTRNVGLKLCKGEYICFLDSDDYFLPNYIETMKHKIEKEDKCDLVTLVKKTVKKNSLYKLEYISSKKGLDYLCQMKMPTSVWAYMYKKDSIKDVFFNSDINYFEDFLFNYIVFTKARNIAFVKEDLHYYEMNPEGLNASKFSENKFSSINIVNVLLEKKEIKHSKYLYSAYAFLIVSNLLFIAKTDDNCESYYKIIKKHSKKCLKKLNIFRISLQYYILILLSSMSLKMSITFLKLFKYKNLKKKKRSN